MYSKKEVLVITTATPSEGKIIKHLQPVTAHVVAGTNLFSDFFAGMSDIFGGRSGSYKKQLSSIYSEAIERIKQEAKRIGANGVVGLKIDIDEISGQGKSMFMITAIGTAVVIEKPKKEISPASAQFKDSNERVTNETVNRLRSLKILLKKAEDETLKFASETWDFIIQNRVVEMYQPIIRRFQELLENKTRYNEETIDTFKENIGTYLRSLDLDDQKKILYSTLELKNLNRYVADFLLDYIKEEQLLDFDQVENLLRNSEVKVQKRGLEIGTFDLPFYTHKDEESYKNLSECIAESFPERGRKTSKKQLLSSKEKEAWECECGKINDIEYTYCTKCNNNIFGFDDRETKPATAQKIIEKKIILIKEALEAVN
ncbi:YbjQ family protein [Salinimicrobium catena]|uniref:YbjQ family protein n=1 Tax=Salinimicrobium catena TaxID=390640 RepID=UPI002FE4E6A4